MSMPSQVVILTLLGGLKSSSPERCSFFFTDSIGHCLVTLGRVFVLLTEASASDLELILDELLCVRDTRGKM
jgi:hypothetical protein